MMTPTTITQEEEEEEEQKKKAPTPNENDQKKKKKKKHQSIDSVVDPPSIISNTKKNKKRKRESGFDSSILDDASQQQQNNNNNNNKKDQKRKKVRFSEDNNNNNNKDGLIRGKRFSYEEDALLKEAIHNYIQANQLGEEGETMIFNSRKYPQVRRCWFEIAAALPWRPREAVYKRAQALLSSHGGRHKWIPEEVRTIQAYYKQHGANWKGLAQELGRYRVHVKDAWRRYRLQSKKGKWTQDELQKLYDLVNLDLQIKFFSTKKNADKKKQEYGMLKDNISWYAISNKLATRNHQECCSHWYNKLSSPMISQGLWTDNDDYRLIDELTKLDACCAEDVDWDNLLEHRAGDICGKRWAEMSRQLSDNKEKSFMQQVDILAGRYCPEMLPFRMETSEE